MTHPRTILRDAVKVALRAAPALVGATEFPAWAQSVDLAQLPGWAVATPREVTRRDAVAGAGRQTDLVVIVKAAGGDDLDTVLDDLSAVIEALVDPVLDSSVAGRAGLEETQVQIEGGGVQRVGTLIMRFAAERFGALGQPETL